MGKIGKPQKKKKNKIKSYGWYKNNNTVNKAPKTCEQEVPRKLKELGAAIREIETGKRDRNKFKNRPDGPSTSDSTKLPAIKGKRFELQPKNGLPAMVSSGENQFKGKKMKKLATQVTSDYIDNLKATRPLLENFKFKQKTGESDRRFMTRVDQETQHALMKSKIADKFEMGEKDELKSLMKAKLVAEKREKKKQKLKEAMETVTNQEQKKPKKEVPSDFNALPDDGLTIFGDVAHAPPTLSVLPKYASNQGQGHDRPGSRIPELKEMFNKKTSVESVKRKRGESVKRKHLTTMQQLESDRKRESFVEAYRDMKKKRKLN